MQDFIDWLIALLLSLGTLTAPADKPEPVEAEEVHKPEPVTEVLTAGEELELEAQGLSLQAMSVEADWFDGCGNGVYDTSFNPCPDQYNAVHGWLPLVAGQFWDTSHEDVVIAMCVLYGESRGRADVTNSIGARGLFQVMPNWADNEWAGTAGISYGDLLTPEANVFAARKVFDKQGWGAWSAYRRGYVQDCISINAFNAWADETGAYHNG